MILYSVVQLLNVVVFSRLNLKLGISDRYFVMGASAAQNMVSQFAWIPGVVLISQLCPEGLEATMYALLAGMSNLGAGLANYFGAMMLEMLSIRPRGEPDEGAQFDRLWIAALIAAIAPALTLALLPWLIPDATQQEPLVADSADPSVDSLWRQWFPLKG